MSYFKGLRKRGTQILAGFLSAVMLITSMPLSAHALGNVKYGDVDANGVIEEADAKLLEKLLTEYNVTADTVNADVNLDGRVNLHDLLLLRQYLAGMDVELGEVVTVKFDSAGGTPIADAKVCKGATFASVYDEVPAAEKEGYLFAGWKTAGGESFFAHDILLEDVTLVASYEELPVLEQLNLSSFAVLEQRPDVSFTIVTEADSTPDAVKAGLNLVVVDGSGLVELSVTQVNPREYIVAAKEGFNEGASYQLELSEGMSFKDKDASIHTANFDIFKEEVDNLMYDEGIIYIKDTDEMSYLLEGSAEPIPVLEAAVLSNTESSEAVKGSFEYTEKAISVGDILCVYENVSPLERDNVNASGDDAAAFLEVTAVEGSKISFVTITEDNAEKIFFLPDTIPFVADVLPQGETGSVDGTTYDTAAWTQMGYVGTPEYNVGDFLVFYFGGFDEITEETELYFGEVTGVEGNTISYKKTTAAAIEKAQEMFLENPMSGEELLEGVDVALLEDEIEQQAMDSGFAEEAAHYLASAAKETDGFKNMQLENFVATVNGEQISQKKLGNIGGSWELSEDVKVTATIGKSSKYFGDGISLALRVEAEFSVDLGDGSDGEMKIELSATFVEEIAVDVDVHGKAKIKWYVVVPVVKSLSFGANVDIKNYSAISLDVKIYTVEKEDESVWEKLSEISDNPGLQAAIEKAEELEEKLKEAKENQEKLEKYKEDLDNTWGLIHTLSEGEWTKDTYEKALETVGALNVTEELMDLLNITTDEEMNAGVQNLMERYAEMLETESEWITLLEQNICDKDQFINPCFAVGIKIDFMIRANINIALGANMEYVIGKRYSFWFDIIEKTSGSSSMDLLDEQFAFQFYVMGALGLKMGIRAEVKAGIGSTKIGSLGLSAEFGPYVKLWGYFIYEYTKRRPMNTDTWLYDERMMGALYLEFGLYLMMNFHAQALNGVFSYDPTLLDMEFPLLTAGNRINYYDFAYSIDDDEVVLVLDDDKDGRNGYSMFLQDSYRTLKYVDLVEGDLEEEALGLDCFITTLSNRNFHLDEKTGVITVDVPEGVQYMECDLTLTYRLGKLEFSNKPITVTLPLVWTSLSTSELNQKFTATVKVGNAMDGYTQVWSERVKKNTAFDLPDDNEIKQLIGYDKYEESFGNLKYEAVSGYGSQQTEGLSIYADTTYYYEVTPRSYTLVVDGVQGANGQVSQKHFIAQYGDSFDVSKLFASGTNDAANGIFTAYFNTEATLNGEVELGGGREVNQDITRSIDNSFARDILNGVKYTAKYVDNAATVTYTFAGTNVEVPSKTVTIAKGTVAPDVFSAELAEKNIVITGITPALGVVTGDTEYIISCREQVAPKHALTYHTNGGIEIEGARLTEGTVLVAPAEPTRVGHEFGGWFSDENFATAFDFTNAVMPTHDLNLYVKWIPLTSELTFDANEGSLEEGIQNPIIVMYDTPYGTLPTPKRVGFKFLGWFTERVDGVEVKGTDLVQHKENRTLYAQWEEKAVIDESMITYDANQVSVYDREKRFFTFEAGELEKDSFKVYYKRQVLDNEYAEYAMNAGVYDIKLVREEDDTYKYFETVLTAAMQIDKAQGSIINTNPTGTVFKDNILAAKYVWDVDYIGDEGSMRYGVGDTTPDTVVWYEDNLLTNTYLHDVIGTTYIRNNAHVWVYLAEGENYLGTEAYCGTDVYAMGDPVKSAYYIDCDDADDSGLIYEVTIQTADEKNAGTDSNISVSVGNMGYVHLDNSGNDFERGDCDVYYIRPEVTDPVVQEDGKLKVYLKWDKKGTAAGWKCEWIRINVYDNDMNLLFEGENHSVNKWFENGSSQFEILYVNTKDGNGYQMNVVSDPLESLRATTAVETSAESADFAWTWDGMITMEKQGTYNAFERDYTPELDTTFGSVQYDKYIHRTIDSFTVDTKGLNAAMSANGEITVNLQVSLAYNGEPRGYVVNEDSRSFTHTITFNAAAAQSLALADNAAYQMAQVTRLMRTMLSAAPITEVQTLTANKAENNTFTVSYNLPENTGTWGMKFAVNYDTSKVEMTGYTLGDVFTEEQVVAPEKYTDGRYVFLATLPVTSDGAAQTTNTGKLVTLSFKLKDGVTFDSSFVMVDTTAAETVNAANADVPASVVDKPSVPSISLYGKNDEEKYDDRVTITVDGSGSEVKSVQVKKDDGEYVDITATYAEQGYKVTENGTYTFRVETMSGLVATATIVYSKLVPMPATPAPEAKPEETPEPTPQPTTQPAVAVVPQTGDDSNLAFWIALLGISGVGMAAVLVYRKKKNTK